MDKQYVMHTHKGILFSVKSKKKKIDTTLWMNPEDIKFKEDKRCVIPLSKGTWGSQFMKAGGGIALPGSESPSPP